MDLISRQAAIEALWKALYAYEDKTEKQFQESDELDVSDWIVYRIFVQNMSDIDRKTILELPSAQPERWIPVSERLPVDSGRYIVTKNFAYDTTWVGLEWYNHENGWKYDNTKCIAWMPLPEPYKGEQE